MCLLEEATLWRAAPLSAVRWQTLFHTRFCPISQGKACPTGTEAVFNSMWGANVAFLWLVRFQLAGAVMASCSELEGMERQDAAMSARGIALTNCCTAPLRDL